MVSEMNKTLDLIYQTLVMLTVTFAIFSVADFLLLPSKEQRCSSNWVDYEHTYRDSQCFVKTNDGKWIKEDNFFRN